MNETIKTIEIEDFIKIRILELTSESCVYFVDKYNEKYFSMKDDNYLGTCSTSYGCYDLYFQKANIIHKSNLKGLEQDVYELYKQLTFSIPRAEKGQYYYVIKNDFTVARLGENNDNVDNNYYKNFNYFTNEEEATKYAKILQETLVKLRKEEYIKGE